MRYPFDGSEDISESLLRPLKPPGAEPTFPTPHSPLLIPHLRNRFCRAFRRGRFLSKERVRAGIARSGSARKDFDAGEPREQYFIPIRDPFPVVAFDHARHRAMSVFADDRGVVD